MEPPKKKLVIKLVRKPITKETNSTPIKVESMDDIDTFIRNFRSQLKKMGETDTFIMVLDLKVTMFCS
jgi:hypothetical protein